MRTRTFNVPVGEALDIAVDADYIRVRSAAVTLYLENDSGDKIEISEGEAVSGWPFKRVRVSHDDAAAQTVKLTIGKGGKQDSAKVGGAVSINNLPANQGAFTNTGKTVTSASASLVAANAARRYLEIQNKDAAGSIFVNVAGVAATTANGRKIGPGESWPLSGYVPTGEVFAIGDAGSNANIVVIEG